MTRQRAAVFLAVVTAAVAVTVGVTQASRPDRDTATPTAASGAGPAASGTPPVRVVLPGRPGESAGVTDSTRVRPVDAPRHNTLDATFVRMMIVHHAQAVRIAELAPTRAADERVRSLAQRISAAQGPEMDRMRAWLQQRGLSPDAPGHDHASMPGMHREADLAALAAARGAPFDRRFIAMMSAHHQGALVMARDVLAGGTDQTIAEMANEMAVEQAVEIRRMAQLGIR